MTTKILFLHNKFEKLAAQCSVYVGKDTPNSNTYGKDVNLEVLLQYIDYWSNKTAF